jgi:putative ABC transport system permease protein
MIKNYFKLAWRNLRRHKIFSMINIFGLSVGVLIVLLVSSFIYSEATINAQLKNSDHIYLVQSRWKNPDMGYDFTTLAPLAKALKENYPGLVSNYYHHDGITSIVSKGDKKFSEGLQVGDSTLLDMFGFELLEGNAKTALNKPNALALTAAMAKKYFGKTDVLGESLTIQSFSGTKQDFEITAVLKDPPYNTITHWGNGINNGANEFFLPAASLRFFGRNAGFEAWQNAFIISYVELKEGIRPEVLHDPVKQLLQLNTSPDIQKNLEIYFTPVRDYYLSSNNGMAYRMIYAMGGIAFFIMLMAIINFVNITIGNSLTRIREIGVRKVMGSSKTQLILQFLSESVLMSAFSVLIALILYVPGRNFMSELLGKQLPLLSDFPIYFIAFPLSIMLIVGLLAGIYPAFFLSARDSIESLKGKLASVNEKVFLRQAMVSIQFIVAIVVFVAAIIIDQQVNFFFTKDLGYSKERVITARVPRDWTRQGVEHMSVLRNEFSKVPGISNATLSFEIPDGASASNNNVLYRSSQDSSQGIIAESLFTDEQYVSTYQIPVIAGNFFNEKGGIVDTTGFVLNETAVKALGFAQPQLAIGQKVKVQGSNTLFTIGGVVKDFHFGPLQESIPPLYFVHVRSAPLFRYMSFRLNPGDVSTHIASLQNKWKVLFPDAPFDYKFIDDTLSRLYLMETRMKKASLLATSIALVIVLLGVAGLVGQSITRRTKEVGIRKVLGSSLMGIIMLFTKEFALVFLVANVIAWPLGYVLIHNWLNNYAYRIHLTLIPFALVALVIMVLIALLIYARVRKIAITSPANSLRTE